MKHSALAPSQRGAATLAMAVMLLAAMLLVLLAANRTTLLELRQAANQEQSTVAFEAAEAGLEWATAMLNAPQRLGNDCRPSPLSSETLRERQLDMSTPSLAPRALLPACLRGPDGWSCACPSGAAADLATADGPQTQAAFLLRMAAGPRPGVLRLTSIGCSRWAGDCRPGAGGREPASAHSEVLLALQPALPAPPIAALTVRDAGSDTGPFFASHFGLSKALWKNQAAVRALDCRGDCGAALTVLTTAGVSLVSAPGDLLLQGPLTLGTPQRPVLIVADGAVRLQGAVTLHGVLYANGLSWAAPTATVRGALISEGSAAGDASLDLARDAAVLDILRTRDGSFVRLPGSWRDF